LEAEPQEVQGELVEVETDRQAVMRQAAMALPILAAVAAGLLTLAVLLLAHLAALVLSSSDTYLQDNRLLIHLQRPVL
jgi:hypothetical protein